MRAHEMRTGWLAGGILFVLAAGAPLLGARAGAEEPGGEVFDNTKLVAMLKAKISLSVIEKKIASSKCRFNADAEQLIEVSNAASEGGMEKKDIDRLLPLVITQANGEKTRLKELVDRFMNICVNGDEQEYESLVRTLLREGRGTLPELQKHFEEENELKRKGVLDMLGRLGAKDPAVANGVWLMLTDRHPGVRAQAAKAVAALAGPGTVDRLVEALGKRLGDYMDGYAMALGYLGDLKAVKPLTTLLARSTDKDARLAAAFSLGLLQTKDPQAAEALLDAVLDAQDARLRPVAAKALGALADPRAVGYIIRAKERFADGQPDLIRQLRHFKSLKGFEFLIRCLEEDNPELRRAAAETLKVMTGANAETAADWRDVMALYRDRPDWAPTEPKGPEKAEPKRPEKDGT